VEHHLPDTRGKPAPLLNYTFKEPVEIQFLRFELVSYWGIQGGGLQYFAAVPATKWAGCCNGERTRTKISYRDGECKVVDELEGCTEDNCTGHFGQNVLVLSHLQEVKSQARSGRSR